MDERLASELSDAFLSGGEPVTEADLLAVAAAQLITTPPLHQAPAGWVDPAERVDPAD